MAGEAGLAGLAALILNRGDSNSSLKILVLPAVVLIY